MPKFDKIDKIPARVFFEILETKNYQLLKPKPKEQGLEELFISIYDEYFTKSENHTAKEYLEASNKVIFLTYKIETIRNVMLFVFKNPTTKEMRTEILQALKQGCGIHIDPKEDFLSEIKRVLQVEIGILENDLSEAKMTLESLSKSETGFDFYNHIAELGNVLQGNTLINADMTLAVYLALEKSAKRIIDQQKKTKKK
jgi:hypothetical protein